MNDTNWRRLRVKTPGENTRHNHERMPTICIHAVEIIVIVVTWLPAPVSVSPDKRLRICAAGASLAIFCPRPRSQGIAASTKFRDKGYENYCSRSLGNISAVVLVAKLYHQWLINELQNTVPNLIRWKNLVAAQSRPPDACAHRPPLCSLLRKCSHCSRPGCATGYHL